MSIEPIIAFFLIRHLRKILKAYNPLSEWMQIFKIAMFAVLGLFIAGIILKGHWAIVFPGYLILLLIIALVFKKEEYSRARTAVFAVLPFIIISILGDIVKVASVTWSRILDDYLDIAHIFSIIWMVAMLIIYNKQNKALEAERRKTQEEEEQKKWIAAKKEELENEVAERTAEITLQKEELQKTLNELKETQLQLIQQEKLASLGELTAGIAHEIQNPLNFVNNFSDVSVELVEELKAGVIQRLPQSEKNHADELLDGLTQNLQKITYHGKRADSIVKSMLLHSRSGTSQKEATDINALADEYLRLAYHGLRAKDKSFNAQLNTNFDDRIGKIKLISQDISRVLLNLYTNAFYSVQKKKKDSGNVFSPEVNVSTKLVNQMLEIRVKDNGLGIPKNLLEKIYQPFFTTKPTGQGIGLGLSLSYDIIKAHGGEIRVETKEGEGAEFIIQLPALLSES